MHKPSLATLALSLTLALPAAHAGDTAAGAAGAAADAGKTSMTNSMMQ